MSRAHERYRQTDDRQTTNGRAIAYSEREREFTFAKNRDAHKKRTSHKAVESVLRPEGSLWQERFVKKAGLQKSFSVDTTFNIVYATYAFRLLFKHISADKNFVLKSVSN